MSEEYDSETDPEREKACYDQDQAFPPLNYIWSSKADPKNGAYADFAAWERWASDEFEQECKSGCTYDSALKCSECRRYEWWEETDILTRPWLYDMMCRASDYAAAHKPVSP